MKGPYFFFSYARADAGDALDRLFRDLSERVRHHSGLSHDAPGFRDKASIDVGERWSRALGDALRTCRVFVAVYSKAYFGSEYCGKEWAAFRSRYEERMGSGDEPPPLILPVFWTGRGELTLPPAAGEVQYHQESLPEVYVEKGLRNLLAEPTLQSEYERVVDELARKMAEAVENHPLAPYRLTFDFEKTPSAFGKGGTRAGRRERMLREEFEGYLRALWDRLNPLPLQQVTGKGSERESVPLSAVYTALNTDAEDRIQEDDWQVELLFDSEYWAISRERTWVLAKAAGVDITKESFRRPISALEAAAGCAHLVLLGAPGSGKSTFARYLALSQAGQILGSSECNLERLNLTGDDAEKRGLKKKAWPHGALLPVFVELAKFVASGSFPEEGVRGEAGHLLAYLKEREPEEPSPQLLEKMKEAMRRPQGAILILDGLDETPHAEAVRDRLREVIVSFSRQYSECRVLVTSRPYAYQRESSWRLDEADFTEALLADLDGEAIQSFIRSWFSYQVRINPSLEGQAESRAESMWSNLEAETYLRPLARRPLMLTMMADLHSSRGGSLRGGRAELYEKSVDLLLDRWNDRREGRTASEHLGMVPADIVKALEDLAYRVHKERGATEPSEAVEITSGELFEALGEYRPKTETVDERQVMEYLHQRSGILLAESANRYRFPHRSYQEYLAACYFARESFPDLTLEALESDPALWREVVLLLAAKVAPSPFTVWALLERLVPESPPAALDPFDPRFRFALFAGMAIRENRLFEKIQKHDAPKLDRVRLWLQKTLEVGALPVLDRAEAGRVLGLIGDHRKGVGLRPNGVPDIDWVEVPGGPFLYGEKKTRVELPSFRIARFPITNAQFEAYVKNDGLELSVKYPTDAFLLENHPRVNVTHSAAAAFCAWLGMKLGYEIRLPTEEQWEKAARGTDGRDYPWVGTFNPNKCNSVETGIRSTSAVGLFPDGVSPYGVHDTSGNVWEWTGSRWNPKRKRLTASLVLRGGAFSVVESAVRCTARLSYTSLGRRVSVGFRVCTQNVWTGLSPS